MIAGHTDNLVKLRPNFHPARHMAQVPKRSPRCTVKASRWTLSSPTSCHRRRLDEGGAE